MAALQEMRREGMAQRVDASGLVEFGLLRRPMDGLLQPVGVHVVVANFA